MSKADNAQQKSKLRATVCFTLEMISWNHFSITTFENKIGVKLGGALEFQFYGARDPSYSLGLRL
jgi:hypothetical protein